MKTNFKLLAMAAVAMLAMNSCEKENEMNTGEQKGTPVEFEMGISASTRTATDNASRVTTWVEGDAVGIFAYAKGTTTSPVVTNAKYVLTGDKWVPAAGSEIYPEAAYDYYAYYPYQEGVTDPANISLAALADQTSADNYAKSDVLAAPKTEAEANATTVPLTFKHVYAMVEVQVNGDKVTKQPTSVILKGVKLGGTLNLTAADAPTVTATGDATDVTMLYLTKTENPDKAPFSFRAVVPAQEIAKETPLVTINAVDDAGTSYSMQYSTPVTYEAGKYRQIKVTIGLDNAILTIPATDVSIDPWEGADEISGTGSQIAQDLITLPFANLTTDSYTAVKVEGDLTKTSWFSLVIDGNSTKYSIVDDETYGKAIKIEYNSTNGSWYNNTTGFYNLNENNAIGIDPNKTYRLSFSAKTDATGNGNNTSIWSYIKMKGENKFCGKAGQTAETIKAANTTAYFFNLTNEWQDFSGDFTFSVFGDKSGSGTAITTATLWEAITKYDYYIGMAPRSLDGNYYIANVKFEEVIE